jgi:hypothetical protein
MERSKRMEEKEEGKRTGIMMERKVTRKGSKSRRMQ